MLNEITETNMLTLLDIKSLSLCMTFNTLAIQKLDCKLTCPASLQFLKLL